MSMLTVKEYIGLLLAVLLMEISSVNGFTKPCNASLRTVSMVSECPTNQSSYEAAAGRKKCLSLSGQGSVCESFQYHCVLSDDLNSLVEVCAPSLNIIGHVCTMFSSKERSVKRIDDLSCKNVTGFTECPYSYNSTSAYKYQQCYTKAHRFFTTEATQSSSSNPTTRKKGLRSSSDQQPVIGGVVGGVIVVVVVVVVVVGILVFLHKNRRFCFKNEQDLVGSGSQQDDETSVKQLQGYRYGETTPDAEQLLINSEELGSQQDAETNVKQPVHDDVGVLETDSIETEDIIFSTPHAYPAYKESLTRKKSFDSSEEPMKTMAKKFAAAGFYYEGYNRVVTCFHCGSKKEWDNLQCDIIEEHKTLNPNCKYLEHIQTQSAFKIAGICSPSDAHN